VIAALRTADAGERQFVGHLMQAEDFSVQDFEKLVDILKARDGLDYTRRMAAERVDAAKRALMAFGPCETRELLEDIADYALGREV